MNFPRLLALLALLLGPACAAQDITIVYGDSYKPFAWGQGRDAFGVQRDFVEHVLGEKMGLKVVHEVYPWRRAQNYVRAGEKDGYFTVPTEERTDYTEATKLPFYETHFVMHTAAAHPKLGELRKVKTLADVRALPQLRHIHMLGSGWHEAALQAMAHVETVVDAKKIPAMLLNGRADVYIEQLEMFRFQAQELGLMDRLVSLPETSLRKVGWHLFFGHHSKHRHLLPKINAVLREMQASGELERLKLEIFKRNGVH